MCKVIKMDAETRLLAESIEPLDDGRGFNHYLFSLTSDERGTMARRSPVRDIHDPQHTHINSHANPSHHTPKATQ